MQHEKRQQHKQYKRHYDRDRSCRTSPSDYRHTYEDFNINPRTFTQSHTPTLAQGVGVGGGWNRP